MSEADKETFELASAAWFDLAQQRLEALHLRYAHLIGDEKFSMCEVYRNVPAHLSPGGEALAWSFAFQDGRVGIERRERADAAVWISWDYDAIIPIAKAVYSDDQEEMARIADIRERAERNGDRMSRGDLSAIPPGIACLLTELHNELALRTA